MPIGSLLGLIPALLVPGVVSITGGGGPGEIPLKYKVHRTWQIELPQPELTKVGGGFSFSETLGVDFAAVRQGTGLAVDTDGDGATDVVVQGEEGFVTLRGQTAAGKPFTYAVRLQNQGGGWSWAASGALVGKLDGTKVQIIDQNNNGSYADFGVDAMIVGRGKIACFLSKAVAIGDQVYEIDIAADGSGLTYAPWAGAVGTLDLRAAMDTKGKLLSAVVMSTDGKLSFDLARKAHQVPAGEYRLHGGKIGLGETILRVRKGRAENVNVASGATTEVAWGGPAVAEFAFQRSGDEVVFSPDQVWYYGDAGEEYYGWYPVGKSPVFSIVEGGEEIATAIFPGSC